MSLLQEEREIILSNEYVEHFDFAEVEEFVKNVAVNADTYDYGVFLNAPSMETPGASGITKSDSKIILA